MRSRDLKIICENQGVIENWSFYFASIGFYLNNVLIDMSTIMYVFIFVLLTLASKSLNDVGMLDSSLAAEWVMSLGMIAMIPRVMEMALEYGPLEGLIRFIPSVVPCMMMFTFINKSISSSVKEAMMTGEAAYIATGRPNANTHYSWRQTYFLFVNSHMYPALSIWAVYIIYILLSLEFSQSSLPMMYILFTSTMWIVAPIIFCPQPTLATLSNDASELWSFAIATPEWSVRTAKFERNQTTEGHLRIGINDPRATLFEFWLAQTLEHKRSGIGRRCLTVVYNVLLLALMGLVLYSSMLDNIYEYFTLFLTHFLLMDLWRQLSRPTIFMMIVLANLFFPFILFDRTASVNLVACFATWVQLLSCVKELIQLFAWLCLRPDISWPKMPDATDIENKKKMAARWRVVKYDMLVEYLYTNFMSYIMHLWSAIAICVFFLLTQIIMIALDRAWGLHSWVVLNGNLRSEGFCAKRIGYVPPKKATEEVSNKMKYLREKGSEQPRPKPQAKAAEAPIEAAEVGA